VQTKSPKPRVLVGCEESQVVTNALRGAGILAFSCDLVPTRGNPEYHYQMDVVECIKSYGPWDMIILHPDCTAMAVSGNGTYANGKPGYTKRESAIKWTVDLWETATSECSHVALENPISVVFDYLGKFWKPQLCYVNPWEHGHGETKKTCFAIHGLPPLEPTQIVNGRDHRIWKMPPSKTRKRDRSTTYTGIATAIADQWGSVVLEETP